MHLKNVFQIIGCPAIDRRGVPIGVINNINIDAGTGRLIYAMVEKKESLLSFKERYLPLPWPLLRPCEREGSYLIDVDPHLLETAPCIQANQPPDWTSMQWHQGIHAHYGLQPFWKQV